METSGKEGKKAFLRGADLTDAVLRGADLTGAKIYEDDVFNFFKILRIELIKK